VRRVVERQPIFTLLVTAISYPYTVVEPLGTTYELITDDHVVIHLYDRVGRADLEDVEIEYRPNAVVLHTLCEHRAWNKAGRRTARLARYRQSLLAALRGAAVLALAGSLRRRG
jgi:hypothetical protein